MKLVWYKRPDGVWNAECACGATCCGIEFDKRAEFETWHFERAEYDRTYGNKKLACGPKFPEANPNMLDPFEFA